MAAKLRFLLYLVVATALLDLAATAALKPFVPALQAEAGKVEYRSAGPGFFHLRPLQSEMDRWGKTHVYRLHTNSLGMRDARPRDVAPEGGGRRLLLIGDSFTEAVGVDWSESFAGRLAAALAPVGVEVLNAGTAGAASSDYWNKLVYLIEVRGLKVDEVVLFLDPGDIPTALARLKAGQPLHTPVSMREAAAAWQPDQAAARRYGSVMERVAEHSMVARTLVLVGRYADLAGRMWRRGTLDAASLRDQMQVVLARTNRLPESNWTYLPDQQVSIARPGLAEVERHLDMIADLLKARGIAFALAVYPWPDHIFNDRDQSLQRLHWRDWARRRNVGFVDLWPPFMQAGSAEDVVLSHFIPFDVHWNELGHQLVARSVCGWWSDRHVLPLECGRM